MSVIPAPAGSGRDTSTRWIDRVYHDDSRLQGTATGPDHGVLFDTTRHDTTDDG
jgi:hypothetical protein